jgi:hypothetical protein
LPASQQSPSLPRWLFTSWSQQKRGRVNDHLSMIFVKRKVTPPDQELSTILPSPFVLDFTNEKFYPLTF